MSDIGETYYVAMRKKDAKMVIAGTVDAICAHCCDTVVIDKKMYELAGDMKAILCIPCVSEETGLTVMQLFALNHEHMMKLIHERFDDVKR